MTTEFIRIKGEVAKKTTVSEIDSLLIEEWGKVKDKYPTTLEHHWKLYFYLVDLDRVEKAIDEKKPAAAPSASAGPAAPAPAAAGPDLKELEERKKALEVKIKYLLGEATEKLQDVVFATGGKPKKVNRKKKVKGGEAYDIGMIGNTADLYAYAMNPMQSATKDVPTLLNVGNPVTGSLNTDFVDSTKGVSNSVMRSITPNLGGPVKTALAGGAWGKAKKSKGKKM